jgi:hypothetical protein
MEINIDAVLDVFNDLLTGRMTREDADRWAYAIVQLSDKGGVTFTPAFDRKRIWDGVMYLYGVDLIDQSKDYLHTDEEIRFAMQRLAKNSRDTPSAAN